jgi:hypothetical protein
MDNLARASSWNGAIMYKTKKMDNAEVIKTTTHICEKHSEMKYGNPSLWRNKGRGGISVIADVRYNRVKGIDGSTP